MVSFDDCKEIFRENMVKKLNFDFFKNLFRILDKNKQVKSEADRINAQEDTLIIVSVTVPRYVF